MKQTFKQFLLEQNLPDWTSRYKRYSPEEIASMPTMNAGNIETKFKVGNVVFDQERGIGSVPYNQEVVYKGFVAMMLPASFLAFTTPMEDDLNRVNANVKLMESGFPIGSPWLWIDFVKNKMFYHVVGHEGRARSRALATLQPNIEIPVHIICYGGNAKDITPEIIEKLNHSIVKQGHTTAIVYDKIRSIWLRGSHISLN